MFLFLIQVVHIFYSQFLQIQGHYQDIQSLYWSSENFKPIDIAYQVDQTRLVDQAGVFWVATN